MYPAPSIHKTIWISRNTWKHFKVLILQSNSLPSLSSQSFWFVHCLPNCSPLFQVIVVNISACSFSSTNNPWIIALGLREFWVRHNEGKPFDLVLQGATRQVKTTIILENKVNTAFSHPRNLYQEIVYYYLQGWHWTVYWGMVLR